MNAVIIANGVLAPDERIKKLWREADLRIAADGGARNARERLGRAPHVVIGDLDSVDPATDVWLREYDVELQRHPPAKDETDLELALLLALERGAAPVTILGALGGRPDQHLANVLLLSRFTGVVLLDVMGEMWVAQSEAAVQGTHGDTVSLIPLDAQVHGVTTKNLVYPLKDETLLRGSTRGVSNEMIGPSAHIQWDSGLLLVVHLFGA